MNTQPLVITDEMQHCISLVKGGKNVFLTGRAGTGKSTLLRLLRDQVVSDQSAVVAFTGVAANNIGGMTIHKFFGFRIDTTLDEVHGSYRPRNEKVIRALETLIIDEVSMLRADLMEMVATALRRYGPRRGRPFGGVQLILVGDPLQLPPVVATRDEADYLQDEFGGEHFFDAPSLRELDYSMVELTQVFRQKELDFISRLDRIRTGTATQADIDAFNAKYIQVEPGSQQTGVVTLTSVKRLAADINRAALDSLTGKTYTRQAKMNGRAMKQAPAEIELEFKVGAQVMLLTNDRAGRWSNGSLGILEAVIPESAEKPERVRIRVLESGESHAIGRHTWEMFEPQYDGKRIVQMLVGEFEQYPFQLAWAVTSHKSQGKSYEQVVVDFSAPAFADGQVYVALSRCRSMTGLNLSSPITAAQVHADPRAVAFLDAKRSEHRKAS